MFHFETSIDYQHFELEMGQKFNAQQTSIDYQHFNLKIGPQMNAQQIT